MRIGLALNCEIAEWCRFARKNYFYPDMPKNFQTSQYDEPIAYNGWLDVEVGGETVRVEIERAHMEEDTGKSLHVGGATGRIHGADYSLVDYNRAGIPLIEIVTKPVTGTGALAPEVAKAYVAALRDLLRALDVSDVRMEQGSLRCDVNLSLRPSPDAPLGTRSETKNVNSLRSVERAVRYEVRRHAAVLDAGQKVVQETRHFHEDTGATTSGREKSDAEDYRYFPEPDLVPVAPPREWVDELRLTLPEPPPVLRARRQAAWGFTDLGDARRRERRCGRPHRGDGGRRCGARRSPQVVARRDRAYGERARRGPRRAARHSRPTWPGSSRSWMPGRSTTPWPARASKASWQARDRPTTSWRRVVCRSCPTRAPWPRRSPTRSRPTPTPPRRCATARWQRSVRSSVP